MKKQYFCSLGKILILILIFFHILIAVPSPTKALGMNEDEWLDNVDIDLKLTDRSNGIFTITITPPPDNTHQLMFRLLDGQAGNTPVPVTNINNKVYNGDNVFNYDANDDNRCGTAISNSNVFQIESQIKGGEYQLTTSDDTKHIYNLHDNNFSSRPAIFGYTIQVFLSRSACNPSFRNDIVKAKDEDKYQMEFDPDDPKYADAQFSLIKASYISYRDTAFELFPPEEHKDEYWTSQHGLLPFLTREMMDAIFLGALSESYQIGDWSPTEDGKIKLDQLSGWSKDIRDALANLDKTGKFQDSTPVYKYKIKKIKLNPDEDPVCETDPDKEGNVGKNKLCYYQTFSELKSGLEKLTSFTDMWTKYVQEPINVGPNASEDVCETNFLGALMGRNIGGFTMCLAAKVFDSLGTFLMRIGLGWLENGAGL